MKTYTYSDARQNFNKLLKEVLRYGKVKIKRRDGTTFLVFPDVSKKSPLDVRGVKTHLKASDLVSAVRESRER